VKKFNVTVNGNTYEVIVEEVKSDKGEETITPKVEVPAGQVENPIAKSVSKSEQTPVQPKKEVPSGGFKVNAPMPGTILDVKVKEGQAVKKGDVVMILEAMKMENEIIAPQDGTVISIQVSKGASVNTGDVLLVLK